jgi:uncharacterized protein DUF4352
VRFVICLLLFSGLVAGCAAAPPPSPPLAPTYLLPPRPVRPSETALALPPRRDGDTEFTLVGLTSLGTILGSHAEWRPKGRYVRIRLVVVNTGRSGTDMDTKRQQLITADGIAHDVDPQAMLIKRQPDKFELGANVRVEFDLYYDVPLDARPTALRAHGGPTLTDFHDIEATNIPLTPTN